MHIVGSLQSLPPEIYCAQWKHYKNCFKTSGKIMGVNLLQFPAPLGVRLNRLSCKQEEGGCEINPLQGRVRMTGPDSPLICCG